MTSWDERAAELQAAGADPDWAAERAVDEAMAQQEPKSWKHYVLVGRDEWVTNSLVFATKAEAEGYARHLMGRWTRVVDYKAVESDEAVNYHWDVETNVLTNLESGVGRVPPHRVQL